MILADKTIVVVVGARPQFVKHYPMEKALREKVNVITIHTGQHYDDAMSRIFFDELNITKPDYNLGIGGGLHGEQTGRMLSEIEKVLIKENADGVLVYGDTNSTLAGAIAASKLNLPIFHVEAGLRSYNRQMPEEVNRVVTDAISQLLFVPNQAAVGNLLREGIGEGVHVVGDLMRDALYLSDDTDVPQGHNQLRINGYYYATIHRPYNTDDKGRIEYILSSLSNLDKLVVLAMHPRTKNRLKEFSIELSKYKDIEIISPPGYLENIHYLKGADGLITDSGGMQKEAYWCKVPCVTVRTETEWTETLEEGWNTLVFDDLNTIQTVLTQRRSRYNNNLYGDNNSAKYITDHIIKYLD